MDIVIEYLNIFLKEGVPFLVNQLFELLRSLPFVLLVIFSCMQDYIIEFITRIRECYWSGGYISLEPKKVKDEGLDYKSDISKTVNMKVLDRVLLTQKKRIEDYLNNNKQLDKETVLLDELASYQIALDYERIYMYILKSQFTALEKLNLNENGLSKKEFIIFYEKAKQENPIEYSDLSFEKWLAFLMYNGFVKQKNNKFYPTDESIAFVHYIIFQRMYTIQYKKY